MSNYRERSRDLGFDAEGILSDWFTSQGCTVEMSPNPFDGEKDMFVDGRSTESKLQTLYRKLGLKRQPGFTVPIVDSNNYGNKISRNQISKCVNVDRLIFLQRPSSDTPAMKIYEAPPLGKRYFEVYRNPRDDRYVAGFYLEDMTHIGTITSKPVVEHFMDEWKPYV